MDLLQTPGFVIWLTGMRRAGKTTLATQLAQRLAFVGKPAQLLDEDGEAKFLLEGLGTSKDDHAAVVKRFGFVARAVARSGGVAICAALSPYRDAREGLRREVRRFIEVFVDAPLETLLQRDGKEAIYRRALASELRGVSGVDLPYEPPAHPEIVIRTDLEKVDDALTRIFQALVDGKFISHAEFGQLTGGLKPKRQARARASSKVAQAHKSGQLQRAGQHGKAARAERRAPPRTRAAAPARRAPKKAAARTTRR